MTHCPTQLTATVTAVEVLHVVLKLWLRALLSVEHVYIVKVEARDATKYHGHDKAANG